MATYRTCVADANTQKQELEDTKVNALRQIHEVIKQTDQVIKSVSWGQAGASPGQEVAVPCSGELRAAFQQSYLYSRGLWVDAELLSQKSITLCS